MRGKAPLEESTRAEQFGSAEIGRNLVFAGLFLLAAELIGELVVSRVKGFYAHTTFSSGPFKNYDADVLSRDKDVFKASLLFLRDHLGAITSEQVMDVLSVRAHRNVLAHELSSRVASLDPLESEMLLTRARDVLFTLSNLWTRMEIGPDRGLASVDVDWSRVHGEALALLDRVIEKTHHLRSAATLNDG